MSEKPDIAVSHAEWTIVRQILRQYLKDHAVWAFGSRVTGKNHAFSDLDLVIVGEQALSFSTLGDLRQAFDESDLPWQVDIVDWHYIGDSFRRIIDSHKIRFQ